MTSAPIPVVIGPTDAGQVLLLKEALQPHGFLLTACASTQAMLERLATHQDQVVLVDGSLPEMSQAAWLRRLLVDHPEVVVIIMTGPEHEAQALEAVARGADDYLVTSPHMGHLSALPVVIQAAMERRHLKQERDRLQAELTKAQEAATRVDQLKTDIVSMVSHELRTPLATINEFTAILMDGLAGPTTSHQQEYLKIIRGNIDRLARIVDELLDMAKLDAGRVALAKRWVEVRPLLEQIAQSMQPLAVDRQLQLDVRVPETDPGLFADPDKVTQVLVNLLSNAIKFSKGPGCVTVSLEVLPNELQFRVQDTGIGIEPEHLPKLFQKFQQFHRAQGSPHARGTGLGLAISKRLVELHGGRIWVESQPGAGSTFSFTLPRYHVEEVFTAYVHAGIEQAKQNQACFSIVVLSLADFTQLKGRYGLDEMTRVLKEIEEVVQETIRHRSGDLVVRWQRGEMVLVLAEVDKAGSQAIAERVKRAIDARPYQLGQVPQSMAVVTSTVTYPDEAGSEEALLRLAETRLQQVPHGKLRIMVVDDEPKIRRFLKDMLELREFEVLTAASGPDALEQLKSQPVHLIMLDLMMPVMDGYQVYHLLKENPTTKDIPVLIVTAKGERADRVLGLDSPNYNYLTKPFEIESLMAKIQTLLQEAPNGHRP